MIQNSVRDRARDLAESRFADRAPRWDQTRTYCWSNVSDLVHAGLMGMTIPPAYGGRGATFHDTCLVVEEIAKQCALTARIVVEANMGAISTIMAYGSEFQKELCAPLVLAGDKPAICITEPGAGSAATEMTTVAQRVGADFEITGVKHWITGGGVSKIHLVFARVVSASGADEGIGAFIVLADPAVDEFPNGFTIARRERTMGLCGMPEAELHFDRVKVPAEMAVVPPSGLKRGFGALMEAYNSQRVGAGTIAMGIAAGALDRATRFLHEREQFGRPIAEFQGLQWMLADMDTSVHASRLMLHDAARSAENNSTGFPDRNKAARAKLFASETAIRVVNDALQMFGARGYGDQEPLERMARDVRMFTIGGGTAQVLRTQIASARLGMKLPQTRDGYVEATRSLSTN